jgi:hypothetical protein
MASIRNRLSQTPKPYHADRNRKYPPMHQTALSYETAVPDGGRLAPKNATRERESPFFSLRRSPRTTRAILAEASESAPGRWDNPIDDPGLERFVRSIRYIHSTSE